MLLGLCLEVPGPLSLFLLPVGQEVEVSLPSLAPCLPACFHASYPEEMGQTPELQTSPQMCPVISEKIMQTFLLCGNLYGLGVRVKR